MTIYETVVVLNEHSAIERDWFLDQTEGVIVNQAGWRLTYQEAKTLAITLHYLHQTTLVKE